MSVVTARLTARLTAAHGAERPDELLVAELSRRGPRQGEAQK